MSRRLFSFADNSLLVFQMTFTLCFFLVLCLFREGERQFEEKAYFAITNVLFTSLYFLKARINRPQQEIISFLQP